MCGSSPCTYKTVIGSIMHSLGKQFQLPDIDYFHKQQQHGFLLLKKHVNWAGETE